MTEFLSLTVVHGLLHTKFSFIRHKLVESDVPTVVLKYEKQYTNYKQIEELQKIL